MSDPYTLTIAILGAYRLGYDIALMDGPFNLYARLRGAVAQRFGQNSWVSEGVQCPVCVSFWAALPALLLALYLPWVGAFLAVAGGALILVKVSTK